MHYQNEMARQFNGPIIHSMLETRHDIYNEAENFIQHRQHFSIDNATEEELLLIGKFLSIPRPYAEIEGEIEYCSIPFYRLFLKNIMLLKTTKSIADFRQMLEQFMPDGRFMIEFSANGDILLIIDIRYKDYIPFFKIAADTVYNTLPRIHNILSWDFGLFVLQHKLYTRLVRIVDPSWFFSVEDSKGVISCSDDKFSIVNHTLIMTVTED